MTDTAATEKRELELRERIKAVRNAHRPSRNQDYEYGFYDALDQVYAALQPKAEQERETGGEAVTAGAHPALEAERDALLDTLRSIQNCKTDGKCAQCGVLIYHALKGSK